VTTFSAQSSIGNRRLNQLPKGRDRIQFKHKKSKYQSKHCRGSNPLRRRSILPATRSKDCIYLRNGPTRKKKGHQVSDIREGKSRIPHQKAAAATANQRTPARALSPPAPEAGLGGGPQCGSRAPTGLRVAGPAGAEGVPRHRQLLSCLSSPTSSQSCAPGSTSTPWKPMTWVSQTSEAGREVIVHKLSAQGCWLRRTNKINLLRYINGEQDRSAPWPADHRYQPPR